MTFPLAGIVTRRLAVLTVVLVLLAFAGVTAAAADGHGADDADATASDTMHEVEVLDTVIEADAGQADADADADADAGEAVVVPDADDAARTDDGADAGAGASTTQATTAEACTPVLVTHRADGSSGDQEAVSITAQAQEFGVAGWVNVAWQAADGAQLTALTITAMDGTVTTRTSELLAGSAVDVLELRFCGSYDGEVSVDAGPPPAEDADETDVAGEVATDEDAADDATGSPDDDSTASAPDAATSTDPSPAASSGSTGSGSSDNSSSTEAAGTGGDGAAATADAADDEAADDGTEPLGVVSVPTPENVDDFDDTDTTTTGADAGEPETEVLGVQLTQDSSPDSGGGLATAIGLLLLALVAGGGAFLGFRRLRA